VCSKHGVLDLDALEAEGLEVGVEGAHAHVDELEVELDAVG